MSPARTSTSVGAGSYPLPPEIVEASVRRLAVLAALYSLLCSSIFLIGRLARVGWVDPAAAPPVYGWSLGLGAIAGLLMAAFASIRIMRSADSALTLNLGLVFEVAAGFFIALAEWSTPRLPGEVLRGQSSVALWITFFVLAVPTTFQRTLLAALLTATGTIVAHGAQILAGNSPQTSLALWGLEHGPLFPLAIGAALLTRFIYRLGAQVSLAREMGSYRLLEPLAAGGMGEVWKARHRLLSRGAAIKLIRSEPLLTGTPEQVDALARRFQQEAAAIASLHSPHTITLFDYGISDAGEYYYVMELLDGADLDEIVRRHGPLPYPRALHILVQICSSLGEAHLAGLIHRDVKPKNVMLCRLGLSYDFVKVLDFGLAKSHGVSAAATQITADGMAAGTPAFMAPEVTLGEAVSSPASDVYSIGCVAYWLLTGRLVFEADNLVTMALAHSSRPPLPPSQCTENEIPFQLDQIVLDCLAKNPSDRPRDARALWTVLDQIPRSWSEANAENWWRIHRPEAFAYNAISAVR